MLAAVAAVVAVGIPVTTSAGATGGQYQQTNLISDIPGVARITDPNLVNPWGQAASATSPLWVADNGSDVSTLYQGGVNGSIPQIVPLVVSLPGGAPTGVVFNSTGDFVVHAGTASAPANFIFDSESGRITAWSKAVSGTNAQVAFTSSHAVYKGLALAAVDGGNYLYAANFHKGRIDVFNARFRKVSLPGGSRTLRSRSASRHSIFSCSAASCTSPMPSRMRPDTTTSRDQATGSLTFMTPAAICSDG